MFEIIKVIQYDPLENLGHLYVGHDCVTPFRRKFIYHALTILYVQSTLLLHDKA